MRILALTASFFLAAVAAYFAYGIVSGYAKATGTTWERLLKSSKDSATMLLSAFVAVLSGIVGNINFIADAIGQPEVKDAMSTLLSNPKTVGVVMLAISLLTILARSRTL